MTDIKKGDTVYKRVPMGAKEYGQPFTVRMTRTRYDRWSNREVTSYFLKGEDGASRETLTHASDLTQAEAESYAAAQAAREEAARAKREEDRAAYAHEKVVLAMFADKLRAEPERMGPVAHVGREWIYSNAVGCKVRYWRQRGRGLDTVVEQTETFVGVDITRTGESDPVTGTYVQRWGVSLGGRTYTALEAAIVAESIQRALTVVIPALPDPNTRD